MMRKSFFTMLTLLTYAAGIVAQEPKNNVLHLIATACPRCGSLAQEPKNNVLHLTFTGSGAPIESEHTLLESRITFSEDGRQMNFTTNGTTAVYDMSMVSGLSHHSGTPTVSLTTHENPADLGYYYTTFYSGLEAYTIPAGVTAYTASLADDTETWLNLNEISGVLPQGEAVLLKTTGTAITMETTDPTSATADDTNVLNGVDVATDTTSLGTIYTLAGVDGEMAFYKYARLTMPANKAYLGLSKGAPAPRRISFGTYATHTPTGMDNVNVNANANKFILNGQFVIVKDGKMYNAQGAIINNQ